MPRRAVKSGGTGARSGGLRPGHTLLALMLLATLAGPGCTRTFWQRQADLDAYALVPKATHPHWRLPNYTILSRPPLAYVRSLSDRCEPDAS